MFPTLFGPAAPGAGRRRSATGPRRSSTSRCEVADRGEQARSQFRGAIVEALTERLLAGAGPARCAASGGSCSTAGRAEIHPYDVTVERDGRGRGVGLQVGRARDQGGRPAPARRRAARRGGRGRRAWSSALVVFDARRSCEVRLVRERGAGRARGAAADRARVARPPGRAAAAHDRRRPRAAASRDRDHDDAVPRPVRRVRARTASPGRPACCATRRTWPGSIPSASGFDRDWYARARPDLARPGGRARRSCARSRWAPTLDVSDHGRGLPQGLGAAPDRRPARRRDARRAGRTRTG